MSLETLLKLVEEQGVAAADYHKRFSRRLDRVEQLAEEAAKRIGRAALLSGSALPSSTDESKALAIFNLTRADRYLERRMPAPALINDEEFETYRKAFARFARHGDLNILTEEERKAMSVGVDPEGGYLVSPDLAGRMIERIFESSPIRQVAAVQVIGSDALEGINDLNEIEAGWVSEKGSRTATATPNVGKWRIPAEEMYAMPEVTQKLLDDSNINIEEWLGGRIGNRFGRLEAAAFVTGNGVGKPRGFASYATAATPDSSRAWGVFEHLATGSSAGFGTDPNGADKLIELVHRLKTDLRAGATWAMNKITLGKVRTLKDTNGTHVFLPSLTAGVAPTILGYPVIECEDMATYTTADALAVAFGNFKEGYQIVDRLGTRLIRDPFTNKPYVRFYTIRRVGGDVVNFDAIKFLKFGTS